MNYDPRTEPHNLAHDPVTSLVVPRPIGWITTIGQAGVVNLAPYSFFNLVAGRRQPFVMFSSARAQALAAQCRDRRRVRIQPGDLRVARPDEPDRRGGR